MKKQLFIEELEVRSSSSPLFAAPVDPSLIATTMIAGEEGGGHYTTMAVGEEGCSIYSGPVASGPAHVTTFVVGEEGGCWYLK